MNSFLALNEFVSQQGVLVFENCLFCRYWSITIFPISNDHFLFTFEFNLFIGWVWSIVCQY